jgi:hypothetical protein
LRSGDASSSESKVFSIFSAGEAGGVGGEMELEIGLRADEVVAEYPIVGL